MYRGGVEFEPHALIEGHQNAPTVWRKRCEELGIADLAFDESDAVAGHVGSRSEPTPEPGGRVVEASSFYPPGAVVPTGI